MYIRMSPLHSSCVGVVLLQCSDEERNVIVGNVEFQRLFVTRFSPQRFRVPTASRCGACGAVLIGAAHGRNACTALPGILPPRLALISKLQHLIAPEKLLWVFPQVSRS